jgi:hypothetical protein
MTTLKSTLDITSCCMNAINNAWVVVDKRLYVNSDLRSNKAVWRLLPTPKPVIQVSCGTRHSDNVGIVTDDFYIYIAKKNILTDPAWADTGIRGKYFNLWSNGTEFTFIGGDNEHYRKRSTVEKLPRPSSGATPIAINDYNISYNDYGTFLGNDGKIYVDSNMYGGNIKNGGWWTNLVVNVPGTTSYAELNNGVAWIVQSGILKFTSNLRATNGGFINVQNVSGRTFKLVSSGNWDTFIAITTDNQVIWGERDQFKDVQMNGFPINNNKYYGNSTPVTKTPFELKLSKGGTSGIPVLYWRNDIEWWHNGCGFSSGCNARYRDNYSYSKDGYAIEAPYYSSIYSRGTGGCAAGQSANDCWVGVDSITHIFGQTTSPVAPATNQTIPSTGDQYRNVAPAPLLTALQMQITPFNKVINVPDGKMSSLDPRKQPTFSSLSFNIPDPTEPNLDCAFANILIQYNKNGWLDINTLNNYMLKYAFTPIVENGLTIPRYASNVSDVNNVVPKFAIDLWKDLPGNRFLDGVKTYCSGDILKTGYCKTYCNSAGNDCDINIQAFCRTGGGGESALPRLQRGILSTTSITDDMLKAAYPKYFDESTKNVCGCFMPSEFYHAIDQQAFQRSGGKPETFSMLYQEGTLGGRAMCNPFTTCRGGGEVIPNRNDVSQGQCPNLSVLNCIQNATVNIKGSSTNNTFNNNQVMNCTQKVENNSPGGSPPASSIFSNAASPSTPVATPAMTPAYKPAKAKVVVKPEPKSTPAPKTDTAAKSSNTTMIIVVIALILLLLIGVGAFFALKKPSVPIPKPST